MIEYDNQQSLIFDDFPTEESENKKISTKINVVKMSYECAELVHWNELFEGFSTLKAITFSSGINFVGKLIDMFEESEIIFGCENVMSFTFQEIMAFQSKLIDKIRNSKGNVKDKILAKIDSGKAHFYVAKAQLSHEKIYLLSAGDGRKRVIMGSANMSFNAFSGRQRENICYVDGDEAYDWYLDVFNNLKDGSTSEISHKALVLSNIEENIEMLPISEEITVKKALVIEPVAELSEDVKFILDTHNLANTLTPMMPNIDKKGKIYRISPEHIYKLKRRIEDDTTKTKEQRSEYPQLVINAFESSAELNGNQLDLNPSKEEIEKDVKLFVKYMEGYNNFHGEYRDMQYRYFEFANWFFCSPFMATMRDMAARYDLNNLPYPAFGLVYGKSKAGKTSFLETLLKMMIGQKPSIAAHEFTRSSIDALKKTVKGAPIIVDDMVNTRFNQHAIETIKTDNFGIDEHLLHYPAVIISANEDVKAVSSEVIRRTVICKAEAGLTNTEVMKSNIVKSVQKEIGTAFYREYLRRMFVVLSDLLEEMKLDDADVAPDILKYSSEIIVDIIKEYSELPEYIRKLSLEDYFSEQVTGKSVIKAICSAWKTSKRSFKVDSKNNELRYNAAATYEADRLIKELPENLEARKSRDWIILNLDESRNYFGINFRKRIF